MEQDPYLVAFTADDIQGLKQRRDALAAEVAELDQRLTNIRGLLSPDVATRLFGLGAQVAEAPARHEVRLGWEKPFAERSVTELVMWALKDEVTGQTPTSIRDKLLAVPELHERIKASHSAVGNALLRLLDRGDVSRINRLYYTNEVAAKIDSGELSLTVPEPHHSFDPSSFNSVMHELMAAYGKAFVAAEAIEVAKGDPRTAEKVSQQPSRVYSWISRELSRGKLTKDQDGYYLPFKRDGALNGNAASAPVAGEACNLSNREPTRLTPYRLNLASTATDPGRFSPRDTLSPLHQGIRAAAGHGSNPGRRRTCL